ncbi:MAG: ATP synthase F0 subunit B [Verrucomicrobiae bacterium]|nr:ATP synthase F0 subunit B [Verrucomicrobiae bacterium]
MNGTLEMLGIQWQKLLVQGIDFSVALVVLWIFVYKPIFKILDERKAKIADGIAGAEKIKAELAKTEVDRQKTLADAGDLANKIIAEARAAATRVTEQETQKAVAVAEQIIAKAREAAAQERAAMLAGLKREVGRLVVQTTVTVTGKVLTAEDQRRLAEETQKQIS